MKWSPMACAEPWKQGFIAASLILGLAEAIVDAQFPDVDSMPFQHADESTGCLDPA